MSEPTVVREPAAPEARRRNILTVAGVLALVAVVGVAAVLVLRQKAPRDSGPLPPDYYDEQLRDAVAGLDRTDPGWRFADLEAARAAVPPQENAAPLVMACGKLLPDNMNGLDSLRIRLRRGGQLDKNLRKEIEPAQAKLDEAEIEPARAMLFEARKLADFRRGRHDVKWNLDNPLATPLAVPLPVHVTVTEAVANLLALDAEVLAHQGKVDDALVSIRAAIVAVHAIGDEPMLLSQIKRLEWQDGCVGALEEVLRRGRGSEDKLLAVQKALEAEAAEPVMRTAARAERAGLHGLMTALERGDLSPNELPLLGVREEGANLLMSRRRATLEATHAWLLDYTTRFVEIAGRPPEEQAALLKYLAAGPVDAPPEAMPMLRALPVREIGDTCHKALARLRCATAAVAAERYRLANGSWPDGLTVLVPNYLDAVPADPYGGKPLGYARSRLDATVYCTADVAFHLTNVETTGKSK
jgi:hypothetical protein